MALTEVTEDMEDLRRFSSVSPVNSVRDSVWIAGRMHNRSAEMVSVHVGLEEAGEAADHLPVLFHGGDAAHLHEPAAAGAVLVGGVDGGDVDGHAEAAAPVLEAEAAGDADGAAGHRLRAHLHEVDRPRPIHPAHPPPVDHVGE